MWHCYRKHYYTVIASFIRAVFQSCIYAWTLIAYVCNPIILQFSHNSLFLSVCWLKHLFSRERETHKMLHGLIRIFHLILVAFGGFGNPQLMQSLVVTGELINLMLTHVNTRWIWKLTCLHTNTFKTTVSIEECIFQGLLWNIWWWIIHNSPAFWSFVQILYIGVRMYFRIQAYSPLLFLFQQWLSFQWNLKQNKK